MPISHDSRERFSSAQSHTKKQNFRLEDYLKLIEESVACVNIKSIPSNINLHQLASNLAKPLERQATVLSFEFRGDPKPLISRTIVWLQAFCADFVVKRRAGAFYKFYHSSSNLAANKDKNKAMSFIEMKRIVAQYIATKSIFIFISQAESLDDHCLRTITQSIEHILYLEIGDDQEKISILLPLIQSLLSALYDKCSDDLLPWILSLIPSSAASFGAISSNIVNLTIHLRSLQSLTLSLYPQESFTRTCALLERISCCFVESKGLPLRSCLCLTLIHLISPIICLINAEINNAHFSQAIKRIKKKAMLLCEKAKYRPFSLPLLALCVCVGSADDFGEQWMVVASQIIQQLRQEEKSYLNSYHNGHGRGSSSGISRSISNSSFMPTSSNQEPRSRNAPNLRSSTSIHLHALFALIWVYCKSGRYTAHSFTLQSKNMKRLADLVCAHSPLDDVSAAFLFGTCDTFASQQGESFIRDILLPLIEQKHQQQSCDNHSNYYSVKTAMMPRSSSVGSMERLAFVNNAAEPHHTAIQTLVQTLFYYAHSQILKQKLTPTTATIQNYLCSNPIAALKTSWRNWKVPTMISDILGKSKMLFCRLFISCLQSYKDCVISQAQQAPLPSSSNIINVNVTGAASESTAIPSHNNSAFAMITADLWLCLRVADCFLDDGKVEIVDFRLFSLLIDLLQSGVAVAGRQEGEEHLEAFAEKGEEGEGGCCVEKEEKNGYALNKPMQGGGDPPQIDHTSSSPPPAGTGFSSKHILGLLERIIGSCSFDASVLYSLLSNHLKCMTSHQEAKPPQILAIYHSLCKRLVREKGCLCVVEDDFVVNLILAVLNVDFWSVCDENDDEDGVGKAVVLKLLRLYLGTKCVDGADAVHCSNIECGNSNPRFSHKIHQELSELTPIITQTLQESPKSFGSPNRPPKAIQPLLVLIRRRCPLIKQTCKDHLYASMKMAAISEKWTQWTFYLACLGSCFVGEDVIITDLNCLATTTTPPPSLANNSGHGRSTSGTLQKLFSWSGTISTSQAAATTSYPSTTTSSPSQNNHSGPGKRNKPPPTTTIHKLFHSIFSLLPTNHTKGRIQGHIISIIPLLHASQVEILEGFLGEWIESVCVDFRDIRWRKGQGGRKHAGAIKSDQFKVHLALALLALLQEDDDGCTEGDDRAAPGAAKDASPIVSSSTATLKLIQKFLIDLLYFCCEIDSTQSIPCLRPILCKLTERLFVLQRNEIAASRFHLELFTCFQTWNLEAAATTFGVGADTKYNPPSSSSYANTATLPYNSNTGNLSASLINETGNTISSTNSAGSTTDTVCSQPFTGAEAAVSIDDSTRMAADLNTSSALWLHSAHTLSILCHSLPIKPSSLVGWQSRGSPDACLCDWGIGLDSVCAWIDAFVANSAATTSTATDSHEAKGGNVYCAFGDESWSGINRKLAIDACKALICTHPHPNILAKFVQKAYGKDDGHLNSIYYKALMGALLAADDKEDGAKVVLGCLDVSVWIALICFRLFVGAGGNRDAGHFDCEIECAAVEWRVLQSLCRDDDDKVDLNDAAPKRWSLAAITRHWTSKSAEVAIELIEQCECFFDDCRVRSRLLALLSAWISSYGGGWCCDAGGGDCAEKPGSQSSRKLISRLCVISSRWFAGHVDDCLPLWLPLLISPPPPTCLQKDAASSPHHNPHIFLAIKTWLHLTNLYHKYTESQSAATSATSYASFRQMLYGQLVYRFCSIAGVCESILRVILMISSDPGCVLANDDAYDCSVTGDGGRVEEDAWISSRIQAMSSLRTTNQVNTDTFESETLPLFCQSPSGNQMSLADFVCLIALTIDTFLASNGGEHVEIHINGRKLGCVSDHPQISHLFYLLHPKTSFSRNVQEENGRGVIVGGVVDEDGRESMKLLLKWAILCPLQRYSFLSWQRLLELLDSNDGGLDVAGSTTLGAFEAAKRHCLSPHLIYAFIRELACMSLIEGTGMHVDLLIMAVRVSSHEPVVNDVRTAQLYSTIICAFLPHVCNNSNRRPQTTAAYLSDQQSYGAMDDDLIVIVKECVDGLAVYCEVCTDFGDAAAWLIDFLPLFACVFDCPEDDGLDYLCMMIVESVAVDGGNGGGEQTIQLQCLMLSMLSMFVEGRVSIVSAQHLNSFWSRGQPQQQQQQSASSAPPPVYLKNYHPHKPHKGQHANHHHHPHTKQYYKQIASMYKHKAIPGLAGLLVASNQNLLFIREYLYFGGDSSRIVGCADCCARLREWVCQQSAECTPSSNHQCVDNSINNGNNYSAGNAKKKGSSQPCAQCTLYKCTLDILDWLNCPSNDKQQPKREEYANADCWCEFCAALEDNLREKYGGDCVLFGGGWESIVQCFKRMGV